MSASYKFLDENAQSVIGQPSQPFGFTIGQNTDLASVSSFILFILLAVNGIAAILRVFYGLWLRTVNSNNDAKLTAANNIITNSLLSLFLSFSIVLLFMFVNPDVVTGGLDLSGVVVTSMRAGSQSPAQSGSASLSNGGSSCPDETNFKNNINSNGGVCLTNNCVALVGCDTTTYSSIIKAESLKQVVDPRFVTILMCRESKGKPNATHANGSNSIDCGLMQINKTGSNSCSPADLDPQTNIAKGVALIKANYSSITQTYPGITKEMLVTASYNCCSEGNPNAQSVNCNPSSGYPYTLPKWACPILPGKTATNMCFVRNYVCDVTACLSQLRI